MQWTIERELLDYALEISKDYYPKEFLALLRAENEKISELIFVPGLKSSDRSATFDSYMLPHYFDVVGTIHSHPSESFQPSDKDLMVFSRYPVNIILFYPFCEDCWRAYDPEGRDINLIHIL